MSLKKTVQSSSKGWKGGMKEEIMEERGKYQAERREWYTFCLTLKQTQPFPSSHHLKALIRNPPRQQSRHKTETRGEWEGRSEWERWGALQQSKGMQEREREKIMWPAQTSHLSPLRGLECRLSTSKESFPLDGNYMLAYIGNRSAFATRLSTACKVQKM